MHTPDDPTRRQTCTQPGTTSATQTCNAAIHGSWKHLMIANQIQRASQTVLHPDWWNCFCVSAAFISLCSILISGIVSVFQRPSFHCPPSSLVELFLCFSGLHFTVLHPHLRPAGSSETHQRLRPHDHVQRHGRYGRSSAGRYVCCGCGCVGCVLV